MSLTIEYVNQLFENLSTGNASAFFDNVADDVHSHGNTPASRCVQEQIGFFEEKTLGQSSKGWSCTEGRSHLSLR